MVVASLDPNPKVAGNGIKKLKAAGIEVVVGVCADEAMALNAGFLKAMATGMPYVRLKMAGSIDGRTAMASGRVGIGTFALYESGAQLNSFGT